MTVYVEEFLYRGRPSGSEATAAWHVVLGDARIDAFGKISVSLSAPLRPEQAEAFGYPLTTVLDGINQSALALVGRIQAQLADLTAAHAALQAAHDQLQGEKASLMAYIDALGVQGTTPQVETEKDDSAA